MFADQMSTSIVSSNLPRVQGLNSRDRITYTAKNSVFELKAKEREYATRRE